MYDFSDSSVIAQIGIPMALYEVQARSKQRKKVRR
jgi:hypothetical protein